MEDEEECIFYAKAMQGYVVKNMIELFTSNFSLDGYLEITEDGIFSNCADKEKTKLFKMELPQNKFLNYKCEKNLQLGLNFKLFLSHVREVKKKDALILFIRKKRDDMLGIEIVPRTTENKGISTKSFIKYHRNIPRKSDLDESQYNRPYVMTSTEFRGVCKQINAIKGNTVKVSVMVKISIQGSNYICFYVDNGLAIKEIVYGRKNKKISEDSIRTESFELSCITQLAKMSQMTQTVGISYSETIGYPLRFQSNAGDLGSITIFIKDKNQVELEKKNIRTNDE